ncbi:MAG TPA: biotin carboxylase N-terminal domain-containing protein [Thermoanaerobaculia bacterium]|nr:biotin carboxylase N-terminal domain-containing protein [Thermoanaerobaculia bacterium]
MKRVLDKVLVPNRGEIAVRIARACREEGIRCILAHSEADDVRFTRRFFDDLVSLGKGEAAETYLNVSRVIDAARSACASAIHPGYGFLSERPELAAACRDTGITFVGPTPEAIASMGSKAESRRLMQTLGVPVVPGYDGVEQDDGTLRAEAAKIGFPLLVKASAGGGGKGMKIVRSAPELPSAIESARREASGAFGDDRLLLERYVENPRHVEFQVLGDERGEIVHLFERDCSIQRRHQKIVEESPAPRYGEELRSRMAEAAIAAARGVGYRNAGTVEFIVSPEGEFYFLEMNTRLQVEHPVTELVTATDLVRAQLRVAAGEPLPWRQEDLAQRGHAVEVRVYAEDPDDRFLPQSGILARYEEPSGPGIRVDSGVTRGSEVGVRFDPMLAKVIAHGPDRTTALDRLQRALGEYVILGLVTNVSYLRRVIAHPSFRSGEVDTSFVERHRESLQRTIREDVPLVAAALAALPLREASPLDTPRRAESIWDRLGPWGR